MFQIEGEERDRTTEYRPHPELDCRLGKRNAIKGIPGTIGNI